MFALIAVKWQSEKELFEERLRAAQQVCVSVYVVCVCVSMCVCVCVCVFVAYCLFKGMCFLCP